MITPLGEKVALARELGTEPARLLRVQGCTIRRALLEIRSARGRRSRKVTTAQVPIGGWVCAVPHLQGEAWRCAVYFVRRESPSEQPTLVLASDFRYRERQGENTAPTRSLGFVGGDLCVARHGLYDTQCAHDHRRARLLPHDAKPVRANGHVRVPRLLPERAAQYLRCSGHKGRLSPLCCNPDEPAGSYRVAGSVLFFYGMV